MDALEQAIVEALSNGEAKTKATLEKSIDIQASSARWASALRQLRIDGYLDVGSDGSKRVYRKPRSAANGAR